MRLLCEGSWGTKLKHEKSLFEFWSWVLSSVRVVNAMRMPVDDLISNWAYMLMSALAWNLKSWYGLLMPNRQRGLESLRMEFRRFLHLIVLLPVQIVRSGRRIIYRIIGYNEWLKGFFAPCWPISHHSERVWCCFRLRLRLKGG
jgi:hypothetical protein